MCLTGKSAWCLATLTGLFLILPGCTSPEGPDDRTGTSDDFGLYVRETMDGGYIIVGETNSFGAGSSDVWLIKTHPDGSLQWDWTYGGSQADWGYTVQLCSDGGFVIVGSTHSYGAGEADVWLIKTAPDGSIQWDRTFGGTGLEYGYFVQQTGDGGYILVGETSSIGTGGSDAWLLKTDAAGNLEWAQTYGYSADDLLYAVSPTLDGGYILTGGTDFMAVGRLDCWILKTDASGGRQWEQVLDTPFGSMGRSVQQLADEGYVIAGFLAYGDGSYDVWLIRTDSAGATQWGRVFGGSLDDRGAAVELTRDGGFVITGLTRSEGVGLNDVWLVKTDADGVRKWDRSFGGSSWDVGRSVQQTLDDGYVIAGTTQSFGKGDPDVWLIKTDSMGLEEWNQVFGERE